MRVVCCVGDASKQNVERFDVVVIQSAAVATAHLPRAVAIVGRTALAAVARQFPTAPAFKPGVAAQHRGEHVVQIDVADDEQ